MLIFEESHCDAKTGSRARNCYSPLSFLCRWCPPRRGPESLPVAELTPLPLSQQLSTMREPIPVETIVDASLGFSGASDAAAAAAKDRLSGLLLRFRGEVADVSDQAALAERALTFLHKNLFTAYSVLQTRVDTALETGVYNCVSSAVLYLILARSVGLSVSGVRTTDHAFCIGARQRAADRRGDDEPLRIQPRREEGFHRLVREDHRVHLRSPGQLRGQARDRGERAPEPDPVQSRVRVHGRPLLQGCAAARGERLYADGQRRDPAGDDRLHSPTTSPGWERARSSCRRSNSPMP